MADVSAVKIDMEPAAGNEVDPKQAIVRRFAKADLRAQAKVLKELSTVTAEDRRIELRQKAGQLRFGDVIALTYIEDIHMQALKLKYEEEAANSIIDNNAAN